MLRYPINQRCEVRINGSYLPNVINQHLIKVTIEHDLQLPSLFQLEFSDIDQLPTEDFDWMNPKLFEPGNSIEVWAISEGSLSRVIQGEVLGLEPHLDRDRPLGLTVWGCDYLHRLQRGTKTRSFVKMKDSDIVRQIATSVGLEAFVTDSQHEHEYLLQANQSDLQFIQARAKQIGYELYVEGKNLVFQPLFQDSVVRFSFDVQKDLLEFRLRLSLADQVVTTTTRAWDANQKKSVSQSVTESGYNPILNVLAGAETLAGDHPVAAAEVAMVAQAQAYQRKMNLITGEVTSPIAPELKPGQQVKLSGLGPRFSGAYLVTAVTHQYDAIGEYLTNFTVKRDML
ncbi:MAG: contractile injection system protein, VgrG/Pvc8 family [Leptolyngbyaceae cyanobacterium bins.302]|nr:contractile injection system protein, VgrG/Pvc8 family [Leptolyngbyaceae cyanobacterium bins.302]